MNKRKKIAWPFIILMAFIVAVICFASEEYRHIMHERVDNVDARALIVEGET